MIYRFSLNIWDTSCLSYICVVNIFYNISIYYLLFVHYCNAVLRWAVLILKSNLYPRFSWLLLFVSYWRNLGLLQRLIPCANIPLQIRSALFLFSWLSHPRLHICHGEKAKQSWCWFIHQLHQCCSYQFKYSQPFPTQNHVLVLSNNTNGSPDKKFSKWLLILVPQLNDMEAGTWAILMAFPSWSLDDCCSSSHHVFSGFYGSGFQTGTMQMASLCSTKSGV